MKEELWRKGGRVKPRKRRQHRKRIKHIKRITHIDLQREKKHRKLQRNSGRENSRNHILQEPSVGRKGKKNGKI